MDITESRGPLGRPSLRSTLTFFAVFAVLVLLAAFALGAYYALTWEDPTGEVSVLTLP